MNYCAVGRYKYVTVYKMVVDNQVCVSFELEDNEVYPVETKGFWEDLHSNDVIINGSVEHAESLLAPLGCIYEIRDTGFSCRCILYNFPEFELHQKLGYFS